MPLSISLPIPVLCRNDYSTNRITVTPYTQDEWDSDALNRLMLVRSDDGGLSWIACANLGYGEGGVFDVGTVYDYTLFRYEDWGVAEACGVKSTNWYAVADVEAPTPPPGRHYEYSWDGTTFYHWGNGYHPWFPFAILTPGPSTQSFSATIIANLVNDATDEVECTDTETLEVTLTKNFSDLPDPETAGARPIAPDWGETLENAEWCYSGPSVELLRVSLSPNTACPGDTIEAAASHNIVGAMLDGDMLGLTPASGLSVAFTIPDTIVAPGVFPLVFTTDAAIDTPTDTVNLTVGEECFEEPPTGDCIPPAPVACWANTTGYEVEGVPAEEFPECTGALTFEQFVPGGSWVEKQLNVVPEQAFSVAQSILAGVKGRFKSDDGATGPEIDITTFCCSVVPPEEVAIPAVPAAPGLARDCEDETVTITSPAFVASGNAQTASIDIRRRALPDGEWVQISAFAEAGTFVDEDVAGGLGYEYSARACNTSGCSDWSSAASISLISDTLALAWQSPGEDAAVVRNILLRFTAADAGGVEALQVFVNDVLLAEAPARVSGTAANGVYTLALDTRRAAQGPAVVTVIGVGSDGCKKRAALNLVFANTRALGVLYRDFLTESAATGQEISRLPISIGLGELDSDPSRRYWGQVAMTSNTATPVVTGETEPEDAQTAFDAMQPFPLAVAKSWPGLGLNPPGSVLYGIQTLNAPGPQVKIRVRVEQAEGFLAYDTGSERIAKIREVSPGKHLVLAQNPDSVWLFEDDALTLLADLQGVEGATGVTDAALVGDKVYFLNLARLIAFDIDPLTGARQRTMNISPHGESRRPAFIEAVGGKLMALFVDEELAAAQTLCVSLQTNQFNDAWTLDDVATLAWSDGVDLWLACGGDLYRSSGGTAAPVLVESFGAAITAIAAAAVGLADGSLWVLREGAWSNPVLASGAAISAATRAYLNFEYQGALWGKAATPMLYGQDANGGYNVSRALGEYDGVATQPAGIAALDRFFVPAEAEGETEGEAGEAAGETAGDERVLAGTEGGVLLALAVARQSAASAWLHSSITDVEAGGVARTTNAE